MDFFYLFLFVSSLVIGLIIWRIKSQSSFQSHQYNTNKYQSKNIIVTGSSSGIGEEFVQLLAKYGSNIVLCARSEEKLKSIKEKCYEVAKKNKFENAIFEYLCVDVSKEDDCKMMIEKSVEVFKKNDGKGNIDYIVLNAGIGSMKRLVEHKDLSIHKQLMDVNFWGCVYPTFHALPILKNQNVRSNIVVISSLAGKTGVFLRTAYCSSKHALHGFFGALRLELIQEKLPIDITVVCPGFVYTPIHDNAAKLDSRSGVQRDMSRFMKVETCCHHILNAIDKGYAEYTMTWLSTIGFFLRPIIPQPLTDYLSMNQTKSVLPKEMLEELNIKKKTDLG